MNSTEQMSTTHNKVLHSRGAGILMHITSLPSPFGIGDLGKEAYRFADFLNRSHQRYWQILPLTPISADQSFSPYSSPSSMAVNTILISPEKLLDEGLLSSQDLTVKNTIADKVNYQKTVEWKDGILRKAFKNFQKQNRPSFEAFCDREAYWLDDFALFIALKRANKNKSWLKWQEGYRNRKLKSLLKFAAEEQQEIAFVKWGQYTFFNQWRQLKSYCNDLNIRMVGDLPFYAGFDSVDVWSRQEIFKLEPNGTMAGVAGVPPDYFNKDGQLWGMPVYRWDVLKDVGYDWWLKRIRKNLELVDILRLDHFRAFESYWEVPARQKTAVKGTWVKGPGDHFFRTMAQEFGRLPFIAEDLGDISANVHSLREQFGLPGMKVLQFAFGDDMAKSEHAPHNFQQNFVAYTGTHDNNTTRGWYRKELKAKDRERLANYTNQPITEKNVHEQLIRLLYASVARTVIVPMQDILGLDESARMNVPASINKNWQWRMDAGALSEKEEVWLRHLARLYSRS